MELQDKNFCNKLRTDSHILFKYTFAFAYFTSIFLYVHSQLYLSIVILIFCTLFIFYSKVRYAHYKRSFREKKYTFMYIIELTTLMIGVIYNLIFQFFFAKGNEVNFAFCLSLVVFTFPTFIGTMRIKKMEKIK